MIRQGLYAQFRRFSQEPLIFSSLERLMETDLRKRVVFLVTGAAENILPLKSVKPMAPRNECTGKTFTRVACLPVI